MLAVALSAPLMNESGFNAPVAAVLEKREMGCSTGVAMVAGGLVVPVFLRALRAPVLHPHTVLLHIASGDTNKSPNALGGLSAASSQTLHTTRLPCRGLGTHCLQAHLPTGAWWGLDVEASRRLRVLPSR